MSKADNLFGLVTREITVKLSIESFFPDDPVYLILLAPSIKKYCFTKSEQQWEKLCFRQNITQK